MKIREVKKDDFPFLWIFENENREYDRKLLGPKFKNFFLWDINTQEKRKWLESLKKEYKNKNCKILVVENGETLIGYTIAKIHSLQHPKNPQKIGYIEEFFLIKKMRRKGISSLLLKEVMRWFKKNKIRYIGLDVFAENKKVIEIYKKFGFAPFSLHMKSKIF